MKAEFINPFLTAACQVIEQEIKRPVGKGAPRVQESPLATVIDLSITDHLLWRQRLKNMLLGRERIDPSSVASHQQCRLGRWYYGEGGAPFAHLATFRDLEQPHARIHELAHEMAAAYGRGERRRAEQLMEEVRQVSQRVVDCLERLKRDVSGRTSAPSGRGAAAAAVVGRV